MNYDRKEIFDRLKQIVKEMDEPTPKKRWFVCVPDPELTIDGYGNGDLWCPSEQNAKVYEDHEAWLELTEAELPYIQNRPEAPEGYQVVLKRAKNGDLVITENGEEAVCMKGAYQNDGTSSCDDGFIEGHRWCLVDVNETEETIHKEVCDSQTIHKSDSTTDTTNDSNKNSSGSETDFLTKCPCCNAEIRLTASEEAE